MSRGLLDWWLNTAPGQKPAGVRIKPKLMPPGSKPEAPKK